MVSYTVEMKPTIRLINLLKKLRGRKLGASARMKRAYAEAGMVYRAFAQHRWRVNSTGAGDWPHNKSGKLPILIDTGTLIGELGPTRSKGKLDVTEQSVAIKFSQRRHPKFKGTIARLAQIHHRGEGKVPARNLLPLPTLGVQVEMKKKLDEGIRDLINAHR